MYIFQIILSILIPGNIHQKLGKIKAANQKQHITHHWLSPAFRLGPLCLVGLGVVVVVAAVCLVVEPLPLLAHLTKVYACHASVQQGGTRQAGAKRNVEPPKVHTT